MKTYSVQQGDTLWKIAQRYNMSLEVLIAANPDLEDPNVIQINQIINIPELWRPEVEPPRPAEPMITGSDPGDRPCVYQAQGGETLESLSHTFMIPMTRMLYYNLRYGKQEPLAPGAKVILPEPEIQPLTPRRNPLPPRRPR